MKKLIFFLTIIVSVSAQHYQAGAGFTAGLPNDYANLSGGFDVFVEYLTESPFSFRTGGGFAITKFSDSNPYLNDINYSLYWLEGSLIYLPFKSKIEPYVGGGVGYYIFSTEEFNEVKTMTGNYTPQEFNSKISYHAKVGISYSVIEGIRIHLQAKYLLLKQNLIVEGEELVEEILVKRTTEDEIDLSGFYISLGVILKI